MGNLKGIGGFGFASLKGVSKPALAIIGAVFLCLLAYTVFAATSHDKNVGASMTIQGFVETSTNTTSFSFGTLDPGTQNNAHSAGAVAAVRLTNTVNSNVAVDVYLNASNMTDGTNWISFENLSVWTSNAPSSSIELMNMVYNSSRRNGTAPSTGFYNSLAVLDNLDLWFWQDVPGGQAPALYASDVTIHSVQAGTDPDA